MAPTLHVFPVQPVCDFPVGHPLREYSLARWMIRIMPFHTFNSSLPRSSRARAEIREALASLPGAELVVGGAILFGLLMAG